MIQKKLKYRSIKHHDGTSDGSPECCDTIPRLELHCYLDIVLLASSEHQRPNIKASLFVWEKLKDYGRGDSSAADIH